MLDVYTDLTHFDFDHPLHADLRHHECRKNQAEQHVRQRHTREQLLAQTFKTTLLNPLYANAKGLDEPALFARSYLDVKADLHIYPTLSELMHEALDYSDGPTLKEVFALLLQFALNGHHEANQLIDRMAKTYAKHNVA